jgi:hypothetical protein
MFKYGLFYTYRISLIYELYLSAWRKSGDKAGFYYLCFDFVRATRCTCSVLLYDDVLGQSNA